MKAGKPVATKEESEDVDLSESETGSDEDVTWKLVAYMTATGNLMHPVNQTAREVQKLKKIEWSQSSSQLQKPTSSLTLCSTWFEYAARQRHLTGNQVAKLIGHITWSCLLRRPALSLINAG